MDLEIITNQIKETLEKMGFGADLEVVEPHEGATSRFSVRIRNPDTGLSSYEEDAPRNSSPSNLLIGERGANLAALEYVIKQILRAKYKEGYKFTLDINDYRVRQLEDLKQDVKAAAREVRMHKRGVPLRPMSSFERRIVHLLLAEYPDIVTESIGTEPERRVVIKPYP